MKRETGGGVRQKVASEGGWSERLGDVGEDKKLLQKVDEARDWGRGRCFDGYISVSHVIVSVIG